MQELQVKQQTLLRLVISLLLQVWILLQLVRILMLQKIIRFLLVQMHMVQYQKLIVV